MAKTRAIVKRRKAIRNIRKITRTMELIATARFKKAMDRAVQARAYTQKIGELVADLARSGSAAAHPLLESREKVERSLMLILTANRGLCGGYNGNILRVAIDEHQKLSAHHPVDLEVSGKRGINFLRFRRITPVATYTRFEDKPTFDQVEELADRYLAMYLDRKIDRLDVVYMKFLSAGRQTAVSETLLPMSELVSPSPASATTKAATPQAPHSATKGKGSESGDVAYDFYPSVGDILNEIVPASFKVRLYKCFLDAAVSEQIARMVAMKGATENASALIKALTSKYNRARQSQITSELAEIIGTAEALK